MDFINIHNIFNFCNLKNIHHFKIYFNHHIIKVPFFSHHHKLTHIIRLLVVFINQCIISIGLNEIDCIFYNYHENMDCTQNYPNCLNSLCHWQLNIQFYIKGNSFDHIKNNLYYKNLNIKHSSNQKFYI